jgi:hypothetical protein
VVTSIDGRFAGTRDSLIRMIDQVAGWRARQGWLLVGGCSASHCIALVRFSMVFASASPRTESSGAVSYENFDQTTCLVDRATVPPHCGTTPDELPCRLQSFFVCKVRRDPVLCYCPLLLVIHLETRRYRWMAARPLWCNRGWNLGYQVIAELDATRPNVVASGVVSRLDNDVMRFCRRLLRSRRGVNGGAGTAWNSLAGHLNDLFGQARYHDFP